MGENKDLYVNLFWLRSDFEEDSDEEDIDLFYENVDINDEEVV